VNLLRSFNFQLLLHLFLGILSAQVPVFVIFWSLFVFGYQGVYKCIRSNTPAVIINAVSYIAAMEMIVRMSNTGFPHEYTKYAIIFILLIGITRFPQRKKGAFLIIIYFLLLTFSIPILFKNNNLEFIRQSISFNLAGPLCLASSAWFFYRRPILESVLIDAFKHFLLPITATIASLFIRTPNLNDIEFKHVANFAASGYGPNQMASLLGFGILIIALSFLLRIKVFQPKWTGFFLMSILIFRGLITFSRGGMIGPLIVFLLVIVYFTFSNSKFRKIISQQWLAVIILGLLLYVVFQYTNNQTSGVLFERYAGIKDGEAIEIEKYSSGRTKILEIDFAIFLDNALFGIGPGAGNDLRVEYGYFDRVAAHIEYTRLLAEHGIFGIVSLFILFFFPLREFVLRRSFQQRYFLMVGVLFCLTFMLHSATRIALPMLLYGMGFILIVNHKKTAKPEGIVSTN